MLKIAMLNQILKLEAIYSWFFSHGVKIVFIVVIALIVCWVGKILIRRIMKRVVGLRPIARDGRLAAKRMKTLSTVITKTVSVVIFIVAILMIFSELGLNITPILTGAGILGLAVGFGAQTLVKDAINGIFILVEDQFAEGDEIKIIKAASIEGKVKEVNLRRTILIDKEGIEHTIPNSLIQVVSNLSKGESKKKQ